MAEWLKAHAWKACVRETVPWVRIPLSPPCRDFDAKLRFRALGTSGSLNEATVLLEAHRLAIFAGIRSRYVPTLNSAYQLSAPKAEGCIRGFAYDLMSAVRQL